uniref:Serine/threonine-protein phosphatase n=1 Tax=Steinernema glaseri TaxID=37863 RepID=A0A1I7Z071_9BILA
MEKVPEDFKYKKLLNDLIRRTRGTGAPKVEYDYKELVQLALDAREVVAEECSLLEVRAPCVIVGDIHGQYIDLHRIFTLFDNEKNASNEPSSARYLFLGDYVDRGSESLECITFLCLMKLLQPKRYNLLRGNHETQPINRIYGFFQEVNTKMDNADEAFEVWRAFNDLFAMLPLAALVQNRILCMHGGISPHIESLDDIRSIRRPLEDPNQVPVACDLLWSDPMTDFDGYKHNNIRGVGVYFGEDMVIKLLDKLKLQLIMMMNGYGFFCKRRLVTVFSAPRYYPEKPNRGAVMEVDRRLKTRFRIINPTWDEKNGKKFFSDLYSRDDNDTGYSSSTTSGSASTISEGQVKVQKKSQKDKG